MLCMQVLLHKPWKGIYNKSHTSSTRIDLYEIPHIFYTLIIHTYCFQTPTGFLYIYIYIYIYECLYKAKIGNQVIVFNWNHFEMRLLNLRIDFYLLRTFVLNLVDFFFFFFFFFGVLFLLSLRFGQISPLAFFRWFTTTSDRSDDINYWGYSYKTHHSDPRSQ